jgi:hypothetical protein
MRILTAADLALANPDLIRMRFGVQVERTVRELNGLPCFDLETEPHQSSKSSRREASVGWSKTGARHDSQMAPNAKASHQRAYRNNTAVCCGLQFSIHRSHRRARDSAGA